MRLGIMQPYFYPYLGYFSLIKHTDHWIVFDTVQYIEHGWINRNQIIHPSKPETMYFTVPLQKHSRESRRSFRRSDRQPWSSLLLGKFRKGNRRLWFCRGGWGEKGELFRDILCREFLFFLGDQGAQDALWGKAQSLPHLSGTGDEILRAL